MNSKTTLVNKVVLADDDPDHATLFRMVLHQVDPSKELIIVHDGEALLELLNHTIPDLLFLDLRMPCKNGYECLTEIREDSRLKELPVVVYSGSSDTKDIHKSFIHQADLYVVKAFNSVHLRKALEAILKVDWWKAVNQRYYYMNNRFVPYTA